MNQDIIEPTYSREINYNKILGTILSRWYWIAGCVIIAVSVAWLYLSLIQPRYSANASIMLNNKKSDLAQIVSSESQSAETFDSYNLAQSASFIIHSDAFLTKAVADLNYRYSFYAYELWSYEELYPETPFTIDILKQDSTAFYSGLFKISNIDNKTFSLSGVEKNTAEKIYNYGDLIQAPGLIFKIKSTSAERARTYFFRFHTKESLVARAARTLNVDPQNSNILSLTQVDVNPNFSADILNAISNEFIIYESHQRRSSATQRLKFIDDQLDTLSEQVNISASDLESFKKKNNLDNLPAKVQTDIQKIAALEAQKQQLDMERLAIDQLERQISVNDTKAMLNFNLEGQIGSLLSTLVSDLNSQINERERRLLTYNATSGPVQEIDKKILDDKEAIARNIRQTRQRNETMKDYLSSQVNVSRASLEALPSDAKDFINLQTEYSIKQKIYSNLIEERLRSSIALSAIEPGASIIYSAMPSSLPIWPIPRRIYLMAMVFGIGAGLSLIVIARFFNRRIRDIGIVQEGTSIPIIGMIRKLKNSNSQIPLIEQPESIFSESVRSMRNSLVFLLEKTNGKVICVSSEVSGEGRSFTATNLGCALAQLEKKVVIIDADLRKPSADKIWSKEEVGLGAYLIDYIPSIEIIQNTTVRNLDIVPAGLSPTNPSELLQNSRMEELLNFLKNIYDYIIIDTSPSGVVSDAIPLITKADINLFILRSGKSGFTAIPRLEKIALDYSVKNFVIVLNEFRNNPLYQSFYSSTNMSLYFNKDFVDYRKKYDADADEKKWHRLRHSGN